ncbi:hypothetical protein V8E36_009470 [Tilletia maclaganii]
MSSYPDPRESTVLYKILTPAERDALPAQSSGSSWYGSELDQKDGFLHTSTVHQLPITLQRFFSPDAGLGDTVHIYALPRDKVAVEGKLRWDVIKSGETFGHVYGGIVPSTDFTFHRTYHRDPTTGLYKLDDDLPF